MLVENTKENRAVAEAVASLAIENLFFSKDYIIEVMKVLNGERSADNLISEVRKEYTETNI